VRWYDCDGTQTSSTGDFGVKFAGGGLAETWGAGGLAETWGAGGFSSVC